MKRTTSPGATSASLLSLVVTSTAIFGASAQGFSNWGFPPPTGVTVSAAATGNGQAQISFAAEPLVAYVIESSTDLQNWTPIATNNDFASTRQLTVDATGQAQFYRAWRNPIPLIRWAVGANSNIDLSGSGVSMDSFNSADPNLSTGGQYDSSKFASNGAVASVNGLVDLGYHYVLGDLFLGPGAVFGSDMHQLTGRAYYDPDLDIPDVTLPPLTWWPAPLTGGVHDFTTTNTASYNSFEINDAAAILVEPGVQVIVKFLPSNFSASSVSILGGSTNSGTLILYQLTGSASLGSASSGTRPNNFWYFGLPAVTSISLTGTKNHIGVVYAPEAAFTAVGGAGSNYLSGAIVVSSFSSYGHYVIHFDESLRTAGPRL